MKIGKNNRKKSKNNRGFFLNIKNIKNKTTKKIEQKSEKMRKNRKNSQGNFIINLINGKTARYDVFGENYSSPY